MVIRVNFFFGNDYKHLEMPVADPGFPRGGGANLPEGGGHHHTIFARFVQKNWMKLKEFGPRGKKRVQNFTM